MFGTQIQRQARSIVEQVVRPLAARGLSPNMVSLIGLALNAAAAAVIAAGPLRWSGACVLFAGIFDMFDGAVARVQRKTTLFGAFLDSTLDRYSEGLLFLGVVLYALRFEHDASARTWIIALAYSAALLSLIVSYTRARAEGLGLDCKVGLMERPERVILLGAGLLIGGQAWLLWVLVVFVLATGLTGVQRIIHVWRVSLKSGVTPTNATPVAPVNSAALALSSQRQVAGNDDTAHAAEE
jgi:CDP-diacylglycerol--glycerol-3-phosphate 3-phosphatidyltransferase